MAPHRTVRSILAIAAVLSTIASLLAAPATAATPAPGSAVPPDRLERLARGINVTRWFWNPEEMDRDDDHRQSWISDAQLRHLRAMGFTSVRLPIEPTWVVSLDRPGEVDPGLLADLDAAIARMNAADLLVSVEIHGWGAPWQDALRDDPATQDALIATWRTIAAHLAETSDPDMVVLEVLNEPALASALWQPIADRAVAAIREAAPDHTILVGPGLWNGIDGLADFRPPPDPNQVIVIHVYDPFLFTHQNATYAGDVGFAVGIPYPNDRRDGCDHLPDFGRALRDWVTGYCTTETWNAEAMIERVGIAADWAEIHGGVPLVANEFGVMPVAPYRDRLTWLRDARVAFEHHGIGWALWGWDDGFGLDAKAHGTDLEVIEALGLTPLPDPVASPAP
jgi:aryl-phospho-beta-D-glucosidase BglC (GH1 family)